MSVGSEPGVGPVRSTFDGAPYRGSAPFETRNAVIDATEVLFGRECAEAGRRGFSGRWRGHMLPSTLHFLPRPLKATSWEENPAGLSEAPLAQ